MQPTTLSSIPAGNDTYIVLTFSVSDTLSEGVHTGTVTISGGGSSAEISVSITVIQPDPVLNITWDNANFGKVKAGQSYAREITVKEAMGYKTAQGAKLVIKDIGPADFSFNENLGDISGGGSKVVDVTVLVPEKGLKPGFYNASADITAANEIKAEGSTATYEIPFPTMRIENTEIDFGEITFEPGKDTAIGELEIKETGTYTPVEGIKFFQISGERGWISSPTDDYVSPGSTKKFSFTILLPEDASIGKKSWSFNMSTKYAGSRQIIAKVIVSFPGIEDNINLLQEMNTLPIVENYTDASALLEGSISLLENSRRATDIAELSRVMSISSGTRTLLNQINIVILTQEEDIKFASDAIIQAKPALNKITIGNENLEDEGLRQYSSSIARSSESLWELKAKEVINTLYDRGKESEDSNYKVSASSYKKISQIYSLLGDSEKAGIFEEEHKRMVEIYRGAISNATLLKNNVDDMLVEAREKMSTLGDNYIVLNPLAYEYVSERYGNAVKNYELASNSYRNAGEINDADSLARDLEVLKKEKNFIVTAFVVYGLIWVVIFIIIMARTIIGIQNYGLDERDETLGDVVIGVE